MSIIDYYSYLFKVSWPALSGLFLISLFLAGRVYLTVNTEARWDVFRIIKFVLRSILTVMVLVIYVIMFFKNYGDWLYQPVTCQGIVESLQPKTSGSKTEYLLTLQTGEESLTVIVDKQIEKNIKPQDLIEVSYLPQKKEAFHCKILTRQAKINI